MMCQGKNWEGAVSLNLEKFAEDVKGEFQKALHVMKLA